MTTASAEWPVWSTTAQVVVTNPQHLSAARAIVSDTLFAVDAACSRFRGDSELELLRETLASGAEVSPLLARLVESALQTARWTDGDVDPTLGNTLAALGYDRDIDDVRNAPLREAGTFAISVVMAVAPGWKRITIEDRQLTVPADLRLDLGASAKALAADICASSVAERLDCGVLVSLGGDIATAGEAPVGGWEVLVQDTPSDPATTVVLTAGFALATSSTQKRRWVTAAGQQVHHILDPRSGAPAEPVWRSVTVAAPSCLRANALSTASIVRGRRAADWLRSIAAAARLVDHEGRIVTVGGWPAEAAEVTESERELV